MVAEELEVGFSPPQEEEKADDKSSLILEFIGDKGCSYPAEICGELDLSKDTVYRKCRFLESQGLIKRMEIGNTNWVPEWLQPRLQGLWARNIKGNKIKHLTWYTVVKDGDKSDNAPA